MNRRWVAAPPPVIGPAGRPPSPANSKVRVLHVITRFEAGAGGNTLLSAAGMDPDRYEAWVAGGEGGPLWASAKELGIPTVQLPGLRREPAPLDDLRTLVRLVRLLKAERFTIVHAHSAKAGVLARLGGMLSRTPVVVYTLHGRDPWWPAADGGPTELADVSPRGRQAFLLVERALRPLTHAFVAVSPTVARDAVVARIATPGRMSVAPSAVATDAIPVSPDPDVRAQLGIPEDAELVGTVGRLDVQKAPLDFVRMAAGVAATRPGARFVMVGDGPLMPEVRELAERLGVPLLLTGFRQDAFRVASAFDVFVITSRYEGVGRAVTEAMAAGRPVVATAVDGVVDLVSPGATGLLVGPGDITALRDATCWLLEHPEQAAAMGTQGQIRVRSLFTTERMCAALDEVYSGLLGLDPTNPDPAEDLVMERSSGRRPGGAGAPAPTLRSAS